LIITRISVDIQSKGKGQSDLILRRLREWAWSHRSALQFRKWQLIGMSYSTVIPQHIMRTSIASRH